MKILHCCLSCFYIDGYAYQENILPRINAEDGHNVLIIASTETFTDGKLTYLRPHAYKTEYCIHIVRLPYARWLPRYIGTKLRIFHGFKKRLNEFAPDVILFHGSCGHAITTVAKYRECHPNCKLYVDSHEAFYNSARNIMSKLLLHTLFYRVWFQKALTNIDKVLYIGLGERQYMELFMHTPADKLEFYPLGGVIMPDVEKQKNRHTIRKQIGIDNDTTLFVHSGKMDALKKTIQMMKAFTENGKLKAAMVIIGVVLDDIRDEFKLNLSQDDRISFLGWKSSDELRVYISAADMYLQPGSPSATMQMALCCGTPVMLQFADFYEAYVRSGGCVPIKAIEELPYFFASDFNPSRLRALSNNAYKLAREMLDYKKIAKRLYE